ncbi:MAG TPA: hypothetical protein PKA28_04210 [Methylomusa anaerophila]|uniref:Uncharacterized protein n=1 Tax=Methylomusa anaerophila TaxID=1930071 RepID=A0A348AN67_9FIRM|nr:hypothetical protein [Methylomusa anaerophila]BBB92515.1 hypothetical protein MAMMFC1_03208 [Methylomusa anaerophila]HML87631.1 hypothetical protein [Methylomusa anaerophila]
MAHLKTLEKLIAGNGFPLYVCEEAVIAKQVGRSKKLCRILRFSIRSRPTPTRQSAAS